MEQTTNNNFNFTSYDFLALPLMAVTADTDCWLLTETEAESQPQQVNELKTTRNTCERVSWS